MRVEVFDEEFVAAEIKHKVSRIRTMKERLELSWVLRNFPRLRKGLL